MKFKVPASDKGFEISKIDPETNIKITLKGNLIKGEMNMVVQDPRGTTYKLDYNSPDGKKIEFIKDGEQVMFLGGVNLETKSEFGRQIEFDCNDSFQSIDVYPSGRFRTSSQVQPKIKK